MHEACSAACELPMGRVHRARSAWRQRRRTPEHCQHPECTPPTLLLYPLLAGVSRCRSKRTPSTTKPLGQPREKNSTRVQMTREDARACLERCQPHLGSAHNTIQGEKQRNQTEGHSKEARPKTKIAEGKTTQMSTCKFQNPVIRNQSNRYDSRTEPKALLPENNRP